MGKVSELVNSLYIKAGGKADDEKLKAILAAPELQIEIDNSIGEVINKGLMTEDAALNNTLIINKARAEAYDKIDGAISKDIIDLLEDADKDIIKGKKLTIEKIAEVSNVIKKLKEAKKETPKGADKEIYQKQIDDLQGLLKAEKESREADVKRITSDWENKFIDNSLKVSLHGKKYRLPMETEADIQFAVDTALEKVKREAEAKGYKIIGENGVPKLVTKDNFKVYEGGNEIALHSFLDGAISSLIAPVTNPEGGNKAPAGGGGNHVITKNIEGSKAAFAQLMESVNAQ